MQPADPVTLFVASCVMPAALTTYLFWSVYLFGDWCDAAGVAEPAAGSPAPALALLQTASPLAKGSTPTRLPVAAR